MGSPVRPVPSTSGKICASHVIIGERKRRGHEGIRCIESSHCQQISGRL